MVEATNRGDGEAFLDAFADDAVLDDWGRTFTGRSEIRLERAREISASRPASKPRARRPTVTESALASPSAARATTAAAR